MHHVELGCVGLLLLVTVTVQWVIVYTVRDVKFIEAQARAWDAIVSVLINVLITQATRSNCVRCVRLGTVSLLV